MSKNKRYTYIQIIGLILFSCIALSSASSQDIGRNIDWRGGAVGAAAGYNGMLPIGTASSESEARSLTASKGYTEYVWDSINHNVYAK